MAVKKMRYMWKKHTIFNLFLLTYNHYSQPSSATLIFPNAKHTLKLLLNMPNNTTQTPVCNKHKALNNKNSD
jgi:hypothetical protein